MFPIADETVSWSGKVYPGDSALTRDEVVDLIEETLSKELDDAPTGFDRYTTTFDPERFGIREMTVQANEQRVITAYPESGSEVYKWYNGQWNPT